MSREELEYKIAKYEHKYNQLSNQSGGNMSREELEYKIAKYEHKFNQLTNQDGGSTVGITLGTLAAAGIGYYAYKYYNDPSRIFEQRTELLKRVREILDILKNKGGKGSTDSREINDNLQIHTFTNLILKNDEQETKDELNKIIKYLKNYKGRNSVATPEIMLSDDSYKDYRSRLNVLELIPKRGQRGDSFVDIDKISEIIKGSTDFRKTQQQFLNKLKEELEIIEKQLDNIEKNKSIKDQTKSL